MSDEHRRRGGRAAPPDAWGIVPGHEDAFGRWVDVPSTTREALVAAMGASPPDAGPPDAGPPDAGPPDAPAGLEVVAVDDPRAGGRPVGHHRVEVGGREVALAVTPGRCHLPADLRALGVAVQSYSAASAGSWGIGDLADLRELGRWVRRAGGDVMLVNPLDAVTPATPREASPYLPTTRRFRDLVHLRIEEVPGAELVADRLAPLAAAARAGGTQIDRDAVHGAKLAALEAVWEARPDAGREPGLEAFRREVGPSLDRFALWSSIAEQHGGRWRRWPAGLRRPDGPGLGAAAAEHRDRARFHAWVQWLLDEQLREAAGACGLVRDLPIGFDPEGFDAWDWQDLLADGVTVGAPPDALGPDGQDWSLPAFVPWRLRAAGWAPWVETLRSAFRHAAGLRIDHVLGLFRLFWIPPGGTPAEGAYVRQDADVLLDLLAIESQRAGAWVVGEDLGTVEEGVRPALLARDLLRYQVWWFEEEPVDRWEPRALASVTTHDLPTVAGLWDGVDAAELEGLGLAPDHEWLAGIRRRMVAATGLAPDADAEEVVPALHAAVAAAPNAVVLAQLEDLVAERRRPNVPGTDRTVRDNWSRLLSVRVDELDEHPLAGTVLAAMAAARDRRP